MAKAKVKRIATRRARDIDVTIYRIAEMQKQIGLVNAKVESAIMNLGAANKRIAVLMAAQPVPPIPRAAPELPEGWTIEQNTNRGFVLYRGRVGKLTTYCGRDSAVVHAWMEHLGKNHLDAVRFKSRTLADKIKVWWFTNEYGISSPDFKSLEACIRACIP